MSNNFNMIEHHVSALVRAVRDGEADGKHVMRLLRGEIAKAERDVSLQAERLKAFTKDVHLESNLGRGYTPSEHYWDSDRNKDPFTLSSDYINFSSSDSPDIFKFHNNKDWTS